MRRVSRVVALALGVLLLATSLGYAQPAAAPGQKAEETLDQVMGRIAQLHENLPPKGKDRSKALKALADAYKQVGKAEEAVAALEEALAEDPKDVEAYKGLGRLFREQLRHQEILVYVKGRRPQMDVPPVIREGRTLIPFRALAQGLKAEVSWDPETKTVTVVKGDVTVVLTLGETTAYVNGEPVELGVPATLVNNRTMVPLRFIAQALRANVDWDAENEMVIVTDPADEDGSD